MRQKSLWSFQAVKEVLPHKLLVEHSWASSERHGPSLGSGARQPGFETPFIHFLAVIPMTLCLRFPICKLEITVVSTSYWVCFFFVKIHGIRRA